MWKAVLRALAVLVSGVIGVGGHTREVTDAEYLLFPRLFHLDDYDGCLLAEDALYCLGTFQIIDRGTNPALGLIKWYSEDVHNFNRTRLHRGYCVSERCPASPKNTATIKQCSSQRHLEVGFNQSTLRTLQETCYHDESKNTCGSQDSNQDPNLSNILRFERCVSKYARRQDLDVKLISLQYCHTKQDLTSWKVETQHWVFLGVVGLVLLLNVVGTVYDEAKSGAKSRLLVSWSVRRSWRLLASPYPAGDARLATLLPTEGGRCVLILLVMFAHAGCIHDQVYLQNPRLVERMSHHPIMKFLSNGHSSMQMFVLMSSFLLAQGLLQTLGQLSFWLIPKILLKRALSMLINIENRIAPVYLLVLGYAATWWPLSGDGPLWSPLVEAESAACRNKFWSLAFFLGNFVRDRETCLVQTWYLQIEMQLYVFALLLTILLSRVRRWALVILGGLFFVSCAANMLLAYIKGWAPLMVVAGPENIRSLFEDVEMFRAFYIKPWASVSASLVGLFLAHLLHALKEKGFDPKNHKRLILGCQLCTPLLPCWTGFVGHLFGDISSRSARAVFLAMERPGMSVLAAVVVFGAYNGRTRAPIDKSSNSASLTDKKENTSSTSTKGFIKHLFSWSGLYPLGRMSLAVVMMHWVVNKTFAVSRRGLYYTSAFEMVVDCVATVCFSCLLAVPVTVLLDIPVQQFYRAVSSPRDHLNGVESTATKADKDELGVH